MQITEATARANPVWYTGCNGKDYLRVPLRMHVHFNPIIIPADDGIVYTGSIYAPYKVRIVSPEVVEAISLNAEIAFFVQGEDYTDVDYNTYIERNLHKFTEQSIYEYAKQNLIQQYIDKVRYEYGIKLSPEGLDYSVQLCWKNVN